MQSVFLICLEINNLALTDVTANFNVQFTDNNEQLCLFTDTNARQ